MAVATKICGVNSLAAAHAVAEGGADFVGFVFYPPSPRYVTPQAAHKLAAAVAADAASVGVFVNPTDAQLDEALGLVPLTMIQLHGRESVERVAEVRKRAGVPIMKAIPISQAADVNAAVEYEDTADWLLFDARPPLGRIGALPGGNAITFDWSLLYGRTWRRPWMLSGGLNAGNVGEAVAASGALTVDVSSGVEDSPGHKNPERIRVFLDAVRAL
jgi:phosphoribosylanthranilate isomerase